MAIKAIDKWSVQRITSGQVIVDLATTVKELLENALDAGATSVEIRFKDYGLESVEVIDNGVGIAKQDFNSMGRKHHTSKLSLFEDLNEVLTYGFRGEALSSICAVADVEITTATASDAPLATRLSLARDGSISGQTIVSSKKGTTVCVSHLFDQLPVRRRDLEKNRDREFSKALRYLQEYAVIAVKTRMLVTNTTSGKNPKRSNLLSTLGSNSMRLNIVNVFGAESIQRLIPVEIDFTVTPSFSNPVLASALKGVVDQKETNVHLSGFISEPVFGMGRNGPDRQLMYINSRPCELSRVSRVINEAYKQFNTVQSPMFMANFILDPSSYDVNVCPVKRKILLHHEDSFLETLRQTLVKFFDDSGHSIPRNDNRSINRVFSEDAEPMRKQRQSLLQDSSELYKAVSDPSFEPRKRKREMQKNYSLHRFMSNSFKEMHRIAIDQDEFEMELDETEEQEEVEEEVEEESEEAAEQDLDNQVSYHEEHDESMNVDIPGAEAVESEEMDSPDISEPPESKDNSENERHVFESQDAIRSGAVNTTEKILEQSYRVVEARSPEQGQSIGDDPGFEESENRENDSLDSVQSVDNIPTREIGERDKDWVRASSAQVTKHSFVHHECDHEQELFVSSQSEPLHDMEILPRAQLEARRSKHSTLNRVLRSMVSVDDILYGYRKLKKVKSSRSHAPQQLMGISNSDVSEEPEVAENILNLTIKKNDFENMRVIGQFNLGFILVIKKRSNHVNDIFIVDQHASDEKANFEALQEEAVLDSQPLVV